MLLCGGGEVDEQSVKRRGNLTALEVKLSLPLLVLLLLLLLS